MIGRVIIQKEKEGPAEIRDGELDYSWMEGVVNR